MADESTTAPGPPQANSLTVLSTAAIFFALGFLVAFIIFNESDLGASSSTDQEVVAAVESTLLALTPTATPPPTAVPVAQTVADYNPVQGELNAPVTMVEFASYTCGFCGRFRRETLPALQEHYGDLLAFVARDFPRSNSEYTLNIAAQCAEDQGAFWRFTDQMWHNQVAAEPLDLFAQDTLLRFAENAALDTDAFTTCLSDPAVAAQVQQDLSTGRRFGVNATPTFFVNGVRVVGARPLEDFLDIIDAELEAQGLTPPPRI